MEDAPRYDQARLHAGGGAGVARQARGMTPRTTCIRSAPSPTSSSASSARPTPTARIPRLDVRHILRPTLPHPDFTPLFDGSSNAGLHLELARDRDGKPVDVLEINGNISDKRAERIEDLLWNLIPEAGHLRDQVGRIDLANGSQRATPGADPASRRLSRRQGCDGHPRLLANFTELGEGPMAEALQQNQALPEATHQDMANAISALAMDAVQKANSGHPGMPMGMADVATVLFTRFLKFDAAAPGLARPRPLRALGRPRLDAALCAALSHRLSRRWTSSELKRFRQLGSRTPGHPEYGHAPGIETTTGPLGQGLGNAVGMALAERLLNRALWRRDRQPLHLLHRGRRLPDGGHQPGGDLACRSSQAWPADRAVRRQSDLDRRSDQPLPSPTTRSSASGPRAGIRPASTATIRKPSPGHRECAGRHRPAVADRLPHRHRLWRAEQGRAPPRPTARRSARRRSRARARSWLGVMQPFEVPKPVLASWRAAGTRNALPMSVGRKPPSGSMRRRAHGLTDPIDDKVGAAIVAAIAALKADFTRENAKLATRQSSQKVLEKLLPIVPGLSAARPTSPAPTARSPRRASSSSPASSSAIISITACASTPWPRR